MLALWEKHLAAEFERKDAGESCDTMVAQENPKGENPKGSGVFDVKDSRPALSRPSENRVWPA